jgi:hypothetical protein
MKGRLVKFGTFTLAAFGLVVASPNQSEAFTIDTSTSWNGSTNVSWFGEPNSATYGQTFTVGSSNILNSFSFFLKGFNDPDTTEFTAYVMAWNGSRATGDILFQSIPLATSPNEGFERFDIMTGNLALTIGQQYVAFFNASKQFDSSTGRAAMGTVSDSYDGGQFVLLGNGSEFNLLTQQNWATAPVPMDAAFIANFSDGLVPVPTPALLPGLIGMGVAALRKKREEEVAE